MTNLDHLYALADGAKLADAEWRKCPDDVDALFATGRAAIETRKLLNAALSPDVVKGLIERVRELEAQVRSDALDRLAEIDAPLIGDDARAALEAKDE